MLKYIVLDMNDPKQPQLGVFPLSIEFRMISKIYKNFYP